MYLTISPQKIGAQYATSVADFVQYLEKENSTDDLQNKEYFFNHSLDTISPEEVTSEIDGNTAKLKTTEPRYYSITVNPSQRELLHIDNDPEKLKTYVRQLMSDYANSLNREINGRPVMAADIKYYAKIEYSRTYSGFDREIRDNAPYSNRIAKLKNDIRKIDRGEIKGSIPKLQKEIRNLESRAPHRLQNRMIEQGMKKPGNQTHVHLIVSRKDMSNSVSLSPGSKYKASTVILHGQQVKRGFDRNGFFEKAEIRFDKLFGYHRNYAETYSSRKLLQQHPRQFYAALLKLPTSERKLAMKLISSTGVSLPQIPDAKVRFALKQLQKAIEISMKSSSIGY